MSIFSLFRQSIYDPSFYRSLRGFPISYSFKYFFSLILGLATALTVLLSFSIVPQVQSFFVGLGPKIVENFPADLELQIENGGVVTNLPEPYVVPLNETIDGIEAKNILVIDTINPFTEERFRKHQTLLWLTRDSLVSLGAGNQIDVQSLENVPNFKIEKSLIESLAGYSKRIARWIAPLVVFGIFLFLFLSYVLNLAYLLVGALLVMGLAYLRGIMLSYREAYQFGIHAISLNVFFSLLVWGGAFELSVFAGLLFLWIVWINLEEGGREVELVENKSESGQNREA